MMKSMFIALLLSTTGLFATAQSSTVSSFIESYIHQHSFSGTVLIQKDSEVLYHASFGLANREFKIPFNDDTKYKICSITKSFTATLILQLYEQGKIDLNAKISAYLPDYAGEGATRVSIHQLLNHTSGLANTDTVKSLENALKYGIGFYNKPYTSDQLVKNFCSNQLVNEPGKKFDYNNGDYIILGKILERIYHKSYEKILTDQILTPLHMYHSGLLSQDKIVDSLSNTYFLRTDLNQIVPDLPMYNQDWYAAGAMYSNTKDLLKFFNALFDLKLIKKETLALMLKPGLDNYGYSVWIRDYKGANIKYKRIERYGSILGANAVVFRYLNENVTVIVLSNTNLTDLGDFALQIGRSIF
ncbi:CubicO group peptidase (beta-lactamase class C family) [Pedobacter alluvionis]|nr:CubicO group peptidase (beta-lactamase class C family) [Pedobacter alluvionis]